MKKEGNIVFHIYSSEHESSGEVRRIRNIYNNFTGEVGENIIEICFLSSKSIRTAERFTLGDKTSRKYHLVRLPFSISVPFMMWLNTIWSSIAILFLCLRYRPKAIFSEYLTSGGSMMFAPRKIPYIMDVHGASIEEYLYSCPKPRKSLLHWMRFVERVGIKRANRIICQSEEMKRYLIDKYPYLVPDRIFVYRCATDSKLFNYDTESRKRIRREIGVPEEGVLLTYSGGLMKWQKVPEVLGIFRRLAEDNGGIYLLLLTPDQIGAGRLVGTICPDLKDRIIIKGVKSHEVPAYLSASDAGFLLRDPDVMNAVAFPTKLGEYMMCGLPVISSDVSSKWIQDVSYIFNTDQRPVDELIPFILSRKKEDVISFGLSHLSLEQDMKESERFLHSF